MARLIDISKFDVFSFQLQEDQTLEFAYGAEWMLEQIDKEPIVEAIPRDEYEARLRADMGAMLTEILTDFDNQIEPNSTRIDCESIIEQKIQALKGKTDGEK